MDKNNAVIYLKAYNVIALEHLKAMNKKFAFIVVQNGPKKMGIIKVFKTIGVTIVNASFLEAIA